jgi:hypothetical protein
MDRLQEVESIVNQLNNCSTQPENAATAPSPKEYQKLADQIKNVES